MHSEAAGAHSRPAVRFYPVLQTGWFSGCCVCEPAVLPIGSSRRPSVGWEHMQWHGPPWQRPSFKSSPAVMAGPKSGSHARAPPRKPTGGFRVRPMGRNLSPPPALSCGESPPRDVLPLAARGTGARHGESGPSSPWTRAPAAPRCTGGAAAGPFRQGPYNQPLPSATWTASARLRTPSF
jgi:hypothetical protein